MNFRPKSLAKAAKPCRQILANTKITVDGPGTILQDIRLLLDFIGPEGIPTGSSNGNLPAAALPELNARLSDPVELYLNRPLLKDYPNLSGFYILLRVMDLLHADAKNVRVNPASLARWSEMNPTEQYFALMEAWLLQAESSVLGMGDDRLRGSQFQDNFRFLASLSSSQWTSLTDYWQLSRFQSASWAWNSQLQARFGLIEATPLSLENRKAVGGNCVMEKTRRTPWGEAVTWGFQEVAAAGVENEYELILADLPEDSNYGFLRPVFQPFFPEWQKVFSSSQEENRPGTYIFKVALAPRWRGSRIWRRLAVADASTLDGLANVILQSFEFDNDHLYRFAYRDLRGKTRVYNHSYCEEGPYCDAVTVGTCGLPEKQKMKFRFDFGDNWDFLVTLERIISPDQPWRGARLVESAGEAPKQYPADEG